MWRRTPWPEIGVGMRVSLMGGYSTPNRSRSGVSPPGGALRAAPTSAAVALGITPPPGGALRAAPTSAAVALGVASPPAGALRAAPTSPLGGEARPLPPVRYAQRRPPHLVGRYANICSLWAPSSASTLPTPRPSWST